MIELAGEAKTVSLALEPAADGSILLHAKDAIVHGRVVRYEPNPHKNTVGYWMNPSDWVEWQYQAPKAGLYSVEILQGCGKGNGGSTVDFSSAGQTIQVTVEDTGGFQNWLARDVGKVRIPEPGRYTLTVKPTKKAGVAVMDLRQVTLRPVAE